MNNIRHEDISRDSLYQDLTENLEMVFKLWSNGERQLRFIIPVLCAIRLEAFINVVGKMKINSWDGLERKLGFKEKCLIIGEISDKVFDVDLDLNKKAISIFNIRNALVHPKMKLEKVDEMITQEEYEARSTYYCGINHHLRSELSIEKVTALKEITDHFIDYWGKQFLDHPEYWLRGGSTGGFTFEPESSG
ncbi:MAG: hypothetical protein AB2792_09485 [Candidatus Thiodiazotropha sp.]